MARALQVGRHWAVIEVVQAAGSQDRWIGRWALYDDVRDALAVPTPERRLSIASGSTALFETDADALLQAELDSLRTETVLSGTYRR